MPLKGKLQQVMKATVRHSLVSAVVRSGSNVLEKSASASSAQQDILAQAWPKEEEGLSKKASLSRILATGAVLEEAEASLAQPQG